MTRHDRTANAAVMTMEMIMEIVGHCHAHAATNDHVSQTADGKVTMQRTEVLDEQSGSVTNMMMHSYD